MSSRAPPSKAERRQQRAKERRARKSAPAREEETPFAAGEGRLEVRPTARKGQGLFALQPIPAARYIMDYEGELITEAEKDARSWTPLVPTGHCARVHTTRGVCTSLCPALLIRCSPPTYRQVSCRVAPGVLRAGYVQLLRRRARSSLVGHRTLFQPQQHA